MQLIQLQYKQLRVPALIDKVGLGHPLANPSILVLVEVVLRDLVLNLLEAAVLDEKLLKLLS